MNNTKLDTMTKPQRAAFARQVYGRIALKHNAATRLMIARIVGRGAEVAR